MAEAHDGQLDDEICGNLRLKRKVGGTGYMYVTGPKLKSKKNPYQARVKNNRTGQTQNLGLFPTALAAAVAVASALANGDADDMDSPQKRRKRGVFAALFCHLPHPLFHQLPCSVLCCADRIGPSLCRKRQGRGGGQGGGLGGVG